MEGQAAGFPASRRHDEDVEVAEAVRGEGDPLPVVTPHRGVVVSLADGEGEGLAARGRDLVDIAPIAEGDGPAVGRYGGIPQPERTVLGAEGKRGGQDDGKEKRQG